MAREAWYFTRPEGFEGVVAKRLTSVYLLGRRSHDWIKVKSADQTGTGPATG